LACCEAKLKAMFNPVPAGCTLTFATEEARLAGTSAYFHILCRLAVLHVTALDKVRGSKGTRPRDAR
ncbi:MAG: hypothetical protein MHM6MM_003661, partial [Cercozoa sp. M6MM]